jgi:hypothetical protein
MLKDQTLQAGETLDLSFEVSNFQDLSAYQFALDFDPGQLQFIGFETLGAIPMSLEDHFGAYNASQGELRSAWATSTGITLTEGTAVFRARFKALASGQKLSEVLRLDDSQIECKAFTEAMIPVEMRLVFAESVDASSPVNAQGMALTLMQNRPNPFTASTTLGFVLPEACETKIRILDMSGRELMYYDRSYTAGYHELELRMDNAAAYGLLFCELITPGGTRMIKMLAE